MKRPLVLILLMLVASSTFAMHFSKRECAVNWYEQGFKEGSEGGPMRSLARMASECPRYGYQVNKPQYQEGWRQGSARRQAQEMTLCNRLENAFAMGKNNQDYPNVCAPETYPAFQAEYDRGRALSERISVLQERIQTIDSKLSDYLRSGDFVQMDSGLYRVSSREKSTYAKTILSSINNLVRERQPLEAELFNLQMIR